MRLDPTLLRACAAYIEHSMAYGLSRADAAALLRPCARGVVAQRGFSAQQSLPPDEDCDKVTGAHILAIRSAASGFTTPVGISRAILDAPDFMLNWWCERLGG